MRRDNADFKIHFEHWQEVNFHECDPLNIVWHGNYLKYFERCREAFCKIHHIDYLTAQEQGFATPLAETQTEHLHFLKYGEGFTVQLMLETNHPAKMIFRYRIVNQHGITICRGKTVQVFITPNFELQLAPPPFYQKFLDTWKDE